MDIAPNHLKIHFPPKIKQTNKQGLFFMSKLYYEASIIIICAFILFKIFGVLLHILKYILDF